MTFSDSFLGDFIPASSEREGETIAITQMRRHEIALALDLLTERNRRVLVLRYGLADGRFRTLEEVGQIMGVFADPPKSKINGIG